MTLAFWFWLIMVIWLIWGGILGWRKITPDGYAYWGLGWSFMLWLILAIIGFEIFSNPFSTLVKGGG